MINHIIKLLNLSKRDRIYPKILELCLDVVLSKRESRKCVLNTKTNMQATNTAGMSKVYHGAGVRVTVWGKEREEHDDCIRQTFRHGTDDRQEDKWRGWGFPPQRIKREQFKNSEKRLSFEICSLCNLLAVTDYVSLTWQHKSNLFLGRSLTHF